MTPKPHISATQLTMGCRCMEQWRRRYIERETIPPGTALLTGKAFHSGAEMNFRQKIDTHEDLPPDDVVDATVAGFETEVAGGYELTKEEAAVGTAKVLGRAEDEVAILAEMHATEQAPDYQPTAVEEEVRITLPRASHDILGHIDLIDDREIVIEFKTSARKKPQAEADVSIQSTVYATAYHSRHGHPPKNLQLDTAIKTKTPTGSMRYLQRSRRACFSRHCPARGGAPQSSAGTRRRAHSIIRKGTSDE